MNHTATAMTCRTSDRHYVRNGTYLRVLIAVTSDTTGTLDVTKICDDLALATSRIVVLASPSLIDLDEHTHRLQQSARIQNWELVPADGMHRRIINTLTATNNPAPVGVA